MVIEVARVLGEIGIVIAKLRYIEAELQRAKSQELKRQRDQTKVEPKKDD
jgi:hypothetical protein